MPGRPTTQRMLEVLVAAGIAIEVYALSVDDVTVTAYVRSVTRSPMAKLAVLGLTWHLLFEHEVRERLAGRVRPAPVEQHHRGLTLVAGR